MNVIIIDDESHARENLKKRLQKIDSEICILDMVSNVSDAYISIMNHEPELIFLDIEMPGGDGFSLLAMFKSINFDVIFVTAYSEYALKAFEMMAIGYITKPIDNELLTKVYRKVKSNSSKFIDQQLISDLSNKINVLSKSKRMSIPSDKGVDIIEEDDVMMLLASDGYTKIIMKNESFIFSSKRLKYFEDSMNDSFVRMHRSTIVNTSYIQKYHKVGFIVLKNGQELPVGRKYKRNIQDLFGV